MDLTVFLTAIALPIFYIIAEAYKARKIGEVFRPIEFLKSVFLILITAGAFSQLVGQLALGMLETELLTDSITYAWTLVVDKIINAFTRTFPVKMKSGAIEQSMA